MRFIKSHQTIKKTEDGNLCYIYVDEYATMYEISIKRVGWALPSYIKRHNKRAAKNLKELINISLNEYKTR